jgi:maleylacetoacetate isomerase
MKLYTFFRSSAAYRARIAFNVKGIAFERASVDLRAPASEQHKPAYRAVNPQGLVPAIVIDGVTIGQSLAIIEYLDETHPEPPLLPRSLALAIACDIHPLNNTRVLSYLRSPLNQDEDAVNTWVRHWVELGFAALEKQVQETSGDGRFMFGKSLTLADILIVPQMYNARRFKCNIEPFPTLRGICTHLEAIPAFARAAPEAQPDAS